ncbi:vWA domain-containing protein [Rhizobium sp.]|jgi:Flp pilus assembly protein TadG|uniref:vWA domain-containing protein n=1 Tax=Rhizobium sp. TaxID=391 RepID=UPI00289708A8
MSMLKRLSADRSGNFGIITAIVLPVLVGAAGLAVDVSNMLLSKRDLQEASDAASLAVATYLAQNESATEDGAKKLALDFIKGQMANSVTSEVANDIAKSVTTTITTTATSDGKRYDINIAAGYTLKLTPFMSVFGRYSTPIGATSSTTSGISETKSALSMTLVLDESGSMLANTNEKVQPAKNCSEYNTNGKLVSNNATCYVKKIEALKTASNLLLDQLDKADPKSKYVRTNAIAWSGSIQDSSAFAWGTTKTRNDVINTMSAGGNTESYAPMNKAYEDLTTTGSGSETKIQSNAGNTKLTKYIVFMTDGSNNSSYSDTYTLQVCTAAKAAGIKIYSIAFMAPTGGQNLLNKCSSGAGYYYAAESMSDLLNAFKAIGEEASASKTLLTQ